MPTTISIAQTNIPNQIISQPSSVEKFKNINPYGNQLNKYKIPSKNNIVAYNFLYQSKLAPNFYKI